VTIYLKEVDMEYLILGFYVWFAVMFLLLMICPKDRIPIITKFYEKVLPRLPITGIIKAFKKKKAS
jgi:hypothetical protein